MKLYHIQEAQYSQNITGDIVIKVLINRYNNTTGKNIQINVIKDISLSKKRAAAVARYAVRVIVPEVLDEHGFTKQAKTLRDLPVNVDLKVAEAAADAAAVATADAAAANADYAAADYAYEIAANAAYAAAAARGANAAYAAAYAAADYTAVAATDAADAAGTLKRYAFHLNKMIQLCTDIK